MNGSEFNAVLARNEDREEQFCVNCRLYETPRCWERKQSGRDPGALDWCTGWRRQVMYLCDDGHDLVCYEGRNCPVCDAIDEIDRYQREMEDLREKLREAKEALS